MTKSLSVTALFITVFFSLQVFSIAHAKPKVLTPEQFYQQFVKKLRKAVPKLKIKRVDQMTLDVGGPDGAQIKPFLGNIYNEYINSPDDLDLLTDRFIRVLVSTIKANSSNSFGTKEQIIPLIRHRDYVATLNQKMRQGKNKGKSFPVTEKLAGDLDIVYYFDLPEALKVINDGDLKDLKIPRKNLKKIAEANLLKATVGKLKPREIEGLYYYEFSGHLEPSLILLDKLWTKKNFKVKGDIVVFIPTRGLLVITVTDEKEAFGKARALTQAFFAKSSYRITTNAFVRRGNRWELYR